MRKIIAGLLVVAALGATAQVAAADDPGTTGQRTQNADGWTWRCQTPYRDGKGLSSTKRAVDGCTAWVDCPTNVTRCRVDTDGSLGTQAYRGDWATTNSRLRIFVRGAEVWHRDVSCADIDTCTAYDSIHINPGESASVQCNGTFTYRNGFGPSNRANVMCGITLHLL